MIDTKRVVIRQKVGMEIDRMKSNLRMPIAAMLGGGAEHPTRQFGPSFWMRHRPSEHYPLLAAAAIGALDVAVNETTDLSARPSR